MKEHPILFSSPMVRALLDGSKTQTRRIVKPQPIANPQQPESLDFIDRKGRARSHMWEPWNKGHPRPGYEHCIHLCPYGQPGDRLWVRETWRIGAWNEDGGEIAIDYLADNYSRRERLQVPDADTFEKYWLQCCDDCDKAGIKPDEEGQYHWEPGQSPCRTRPSIFMPRHASRILLEITGVRVERLQDISEEDALAEGCVSDQSSATEHYECLWESINGPGSWDANPWVWVILFKSVAT